MQNSVRKLRMEKGITQAALAALAGVSRQAIIAVETCKAAPSLILAYTIANIFGKTIEEIFFINEGAV